VGVVEGLFFIALAAIIGETAVKLVRARAGGKVGTRLKDDLAHLARQLEEHSASLADAHVGLANHDAQVQELQERVDFAERVLAQTRDKPGLRPGSPPGPQ